jgi:hypothetical protein
MHRIKITGFALVAVLALGAMSASGASANSNILCSKVTGNLLSEVTISKCSPSGGKGYKSASAQGGVFAVGGTFTWSKSGATTDIESPLYELSERQGRCKKHNYEFLAEAGVSGGSSSGIGIPVFPGTFSASLCVESSGKVGKLSVVEFRESTFI